MEIFVVVRDGAEEIASFFSFEDANDWLFGDSEDAEALWSRCENNISVDPRKTLNMNHLPASSSDWLAGFKIPGAE